jgi:endonuclease-3
MVTPALFDRFDTIKAFANADVATIENLVKTCGLYKTKAKSIKEMCQMLIERFDEEIPDTLTELLELPGVGRKTANLIIGELHGKPAIVADTHVIRLSNRLGLVSSKDPFKIEQALREIIPPNESMAFCHRLVLHGRRVCKARNPDCSECCLREACDFVG